MPELATALNASARKERWPLKPPILTLLCFIGLSLSLTLLVDEYIDAGARIELGDFTQSWALSMGVSAERGSASVQLRNSGDVPSTASVLLSPVADAEFLALTICLHRPMPVMYYSVDGAPRPVAEVMLASLRKERLDFSRHFTIRGLVGESDKPCYTTLFPRRPGDGDAVLQVQFLAPDQQLDVSSLSVTPLREAPAWKWTRVAMLSAGLLCVMFLFRRYVSPAQPLRSGLALMSLGAILFGCCVPVGLKAEIFAVTSGGSVSPLFASTQEMLGYRFPIAGFSVFTAMHAVLFAMATLCFGVLRRDVLGDMLLLAATTEVLQIFVPGRGPSLSDVMIDTLGIAVATLPLILLWRSQRVRLLLQDKRIHEDVSGFGQ